MRMPNKDDDLLLQTLRIGMNTSVKNRLEQQLYTQQTKRQDAETYFSLALFNCVAIQYTADGQSQHKCLIDTIDWATRAVESNPEHWPAMFLRSMVRLMMNDESDEMAMYLLPIDYTDQDAIVDLHRMIQLQKEQDIASPCQTLPYVQLAYAKLMDEDIEGAIAILKEAENSITLGKIPYLVSILRIPFVTLYKRAYNMSNHDLLRILKRWIVVLFPNQVFKGK